MMLGGPKTVVAESTERKNKNRTHNCRRKPMAIFVLLQTHSATTQQNHCHLLK